MHPAQSFLEVEGAGGVRTEQYGATLGQQLPDLAPHGLPGLEVTLADIGQSSAVGSVGVQCEDRYASRHRFGDDTAEGVRIGHGGGDAIGAARDCRLDELDLPRDIKSGRPGEGGIYAQESPGFLDPLADGNKERHGGGVGNHHELERLAVRPRVDGAAGFRRNLARTTAGCAGQRESQQESCAAVGSPGRWRNSCVHVAPTLPGAMPDRQYLRNRSRAVASLIQGDSPRRFLLRYKVAGLTPRVRAHPPGGDRFFEVTVGGGNEPHVGGPPFGFTHPCASVMDR